ncbi:STAS-like domain-containing protein [Comamonas aquatica]|uniref:STAS-like domain-containing protein n=1 Tax=Comamonas aquatica TaxID=225991 RepID=UPI0024476693|nr:STAS-like domain-containing protein [Comamonas aquatica]MDH0901409.1 STAS-like domain-containing protein [Comamonas aquatica]
MTTLSIARQFSMYPGGRFKRISEYSGEEFRDKLLIPALNEDGKVIVDLDGVVGYGSSFLEEVFGGLVRAMRWISRTDVDTRLQLKSTQSSWLQEANQYIDDELRRQRSLAN